MYWTSIDHIWKDKLIPSWKFTRTVALFCDTSQATKVAASLVWQIFAPNCVIFSFLCKASSNLDSQKSMSDAIQRRRNFICHSYITQRLCAWLWHRSSWLLSARCLCVSVGPHQSKLVRIRCICESMHVRWSVRDEHQYPVSHSALWVHVKLWRT